MIGGGIIEAAMGDGVRQRGSSWLELEGSRPLLDETLANHDLLEDMFVYDDGRAWVSAEMLLQEMVQKDAYQVSRGRCIAVICNGGPDCD